MSRSLLELSDYLVGHWELTKDFKDSSGNEIHGVPSDVNWNTSSRGLKPHGNGNSPRILCPRNEVLDLNDEFAISFMVKLSIDAPDWMQIMLYGTNYYIFRQSSTNSINFRTYDGTTVGNCLVAGLFDNEWHHVVFTFERLNDQRVYVDGVLASTDDTIPTGDITGTNLLNIMSDGGAALSGFIDDIQIRNTRIDATESLTLHNSTKETYGVTYAERSYSHKLSPEITDDTVFATDMSTKNSDSTLVDLSGNSNHGTVNGAVRSGGYFIDGLYTNGTIDYIDVGDVS